MKKLLYLIILLPALAFGQGSPLATKIAAYRKAGEWQLWADSINAAINRWPPMSLGKEFGAHTGLASMDPNDDWTLNSIAWDAFQHCTDKTVLKSALKWINLSISINPDIENVKSGNIGLADALIDTKANLLYKLGRVRDAIKTETSINKIDKTDSSEKNVAAVVAKMQTGEKTW